MKIIFIGSQEEINGFTFACKNIFKDDFQDRLNDDAAILKNKKFDMEIYCYRTTEVQNFNSDYYKRRLENIKAVIAFDSQNNQHKEHWSKDITFSDIPVIFYKYGNNLVEFFTKNDGGNLLEFTSKNHDNLVALFTQVKSAASYGSSVRFYQTDEEFRKQYKPETSMLDTLTTLINRFAK